MGEGLNNSLFPQKMSTDVLYFSFSRSALADFWKRTKRKIKQRLCTGYVSTG